MKVPHLGVLAMLVACAGDGDTPGDPTGASAETGTAPLPEGTGLGDVLVELNEASVVAPADTRVLAVFTDPPSDVTNLAQCLAGQQFCLREPPPDAIGASVDAEGFDPVLLEALRTVSAGDQISLGDWTASEVFDSATGLRFYTRVADGLEAPAPSLDLSIPGADWPSIEVADVVEPPLPVGLRFVDPNVEQEFFDTDGIPLRWMPGEDSGDEPPNDEGSGSTGTAGEMFLYVETPGRRRVQRLEDNGRFDLDLSGASLADGDPVEIILGRWSRRALVEGDRSTQVTVQRNQRIRGRWRSIGVRQRLSLAETCAGARETAGIDDGYYEGRFEPSQSTLDPGAEGCTGRAAGGPEGLVPVDVRPQHELTVRFALADAEASLYLLTDCDDTGSCLVGADATGPETVRWTNESSDLTRVFVVMDVVGAPAGDFTLDVQRRALGGDVFVNTCLEAMEQGPIGPGFFEGGLLDHGNLLASYPEDGPCGGVRQAGEGIASVVLAGGQTLDINALGSTPGTGIHLLANCSIAATCVAFGTETLRYTNPSPFERTVYIVLDAELGIDQYRLDVTF